MQAAEQDWLLRQVCAPLGLAISDEQTSRLLGYVDLLLRWNTTYNLTAVRDREGMLTQHLADCLAAVPALQRHLVKAAPSATSARSATSPISPTSSSLRLLDVGSGGGMPGAVLAIMLPHLQVTTIDTVGKKAAFVRQVAGGLGLPNLHPVHGRVEVLQTSPFDVLTARAFSSLTDFVHLTRQQLAPGGVWMAMKGKEPLEEMAALPADIRVFHVEQLVVPGLEAHRCLVWMKPRSAPSSHDAVKETA